MNGQTITELTCRRLSPREVEVLRIAALGRTNIEIARRLGISLHAVKFHLASVYRKLGVSNRTEAAVRFLAEAGDLDISLDGPLSRQLATTDPR